MRRAWLPWLFVLAMVLLAAPEAALGRAERGAGDPLPDQRARSAGPAVPNDDAGLFRSFFDGRLCPLEVRLFADAADGRLDESSLLTAALVASGVDDLATLHRYQRQQDALVKELRESGQLSGPPDHRAEVVFEFMHRRVLNSGYGIDCTDLRMALDRGRFNCVSASVLFGSLAGEVGLEVCGLECPGHVMSRVLLPGGSLDVETTCPGWFRCRHDPQRRTEVVEEATGRRPSEDELQARSQARTVSPVQMVALIYYNRGVDLLARQQFDQAAVANAKALRLDPTSVTARGNLLATINNWAIALGNGGHYPEAARLLRQGLDFDPHYETFTLNYAHVHRQWISHLIASGHPSMAGQIARQSSSDPYLQSQ